MAKIKCLFSKLSRRQTFIAVMTLIVGALAFAFVYPEHVPDMIKGFTLTGLF